MTYVRRVGSEGEISILNDQPIQLDPSLAGEYVIALIETPDLDLTVVTAEGEIVPAIRAAGAR
ncbi:MAG TPA: hypothetical protein VEU77_07770 [Candidatus Acidoferrales bacterium]|nr:hypothetical protein [Candidatus Acidoferrales bacterium]